MNTEITNKTLRKAKADKKDEFYTRIEDIAEEVEHYKDYFAGKTVYCNCDSQWSAFWKYFKSNFNELGLKMLYATGYDEDGGDYASFDGKAVKSGKLKGNGSFDSDESLSILKHADIVCSNPPFSLFARYLPLMVNSGVDVLAIGNQNMMTIPEIFKLIKQHKVFPGYGFKSSVGYFKNEHYDDFATSNGHKEGMIRVNGVMWYTTIPSEGLSNKLELKGVYSGNEDKYRKFDDYDALNVDKLSDIPNDYYGPIGVPITFLKKFNPDQFEIIGMDRELNNKKRFKLDGVEKFARVIIKRKPQDTEEVKKYNDLTNRMNNI